MDGIENALIKSTMLGIEDHGIFSYWLHLSMDGTSQGFGGYTLDNPKFDGIPQHANDKRGKFLGRHGTDYGAESIMLILETVGVDSWEKLKGQHCRVVRENGLLTGIGHIVEDKWFYPAKLAENYK